MQLMGGSQPVIIVSLNIVQDATKISVLVLVVSILAPVAHAYKHQCQDQVMNCVKVATVTVLKNVTKVSNFSC